MLELVSFNNFKALREFSTRLEQFTLLIGPNASGKSSVLQGIDLVGKLIKNEPPAVFRGEYAPSAIRTCDPTGLVEFHITATAARTNPHIDCQIKDVPKEWPNEEGWECVIKSNTARGPAPPYRQSATSISSVYPDTAKVWPSTSLLSFDPQRLAQSSHGDFPRKALDVDGYGLPSLLATISATTPEIFELLGRSLHRLAPAINRIRLSPTTIDETKKVWFQAGSGEEGFYEQAAQNEGVKVLLELSAGGIIPVHAAGEGVLLTLGLLATIFTSNHDPVLLLDNLDRGLHPRALHDFVHQIRDLLAAQPGLQIVATTHSPYLVDLFQPHEVRLMCLDANGHAVVGSLANHPEFERWKEEMLPGEFWSMVGEKWLLDRQHVSAPA